MSVVAIVQARIGSSRDVEALFRETLERIAAVATSAQAREHVTAYIMEQPEQFRVRAVCDELDHSDLRWTVDPAEALELVRQLVELIRARPDLSTINTHVVQENINVQATNVS